MRWSGGGAADHASVWDEKTNNWTCLMSSSTTRNTNKTCQLGSTTEVFILKIMILLKLESFLQTFRFVLINKFWKHVSRGNFWRRIGCSYQLRRKTMTLTSFYNIMVFFLDLREIILKVSSKLLGTGSKIRENIMCGDIGTLWMIGCRQVWEEMK